MEVKAKDQVLFISSYPPRECGIATFTQDLVHAFNGIYNQTLEARVCALEEEQQKGYPQEVILTLKTNRPEHYQNVAHYINTHEQIISVVIEHEFGLFKGEYGEHIFYLLDEIRKPVFICFHTVLANPDARLLEVVSRIAAHMEKIIVLTEHSKQILQSDYNIPASQINVIPHGIHLVKPIVNRQALKSKYGFDHKMIMSTFGLISSNKGIETALEAIAALPDKKNILYLILGKTHPNVFKQEGEKYREYLTKRVYELDIEEHVLFVNKYLDLPELLTYLKLTDIYLFTSKDPSQTVSGTLSYAMGTGCTVVSTPIPHAKEVLKNDAGYIFDFGNSQQLSSIITDLMEHPDKLKETSMNAARLAKGNAWENIANQFAVLVKPYIRNYSSLTYNLPSLKLNHLCKLTTSRGMVQFCEMCEPDMKSGYTTDDNARALYVLTLYNELYPNDPFVNNYFTIYLSFLEKTQLSQGNFLNYMNHEGEFTAQNYIENLDEANARAFVALSRFVYSADVHERLKFVAMRMISKSLKHMYQINSPRSIAKVIKGLYFLQQYKSELQDLSAVHLLSQELMRLYTETSSPEWEWFEPYLTYNNSAIPEGLMYAYLATNNILYKKVAERSFDFLLSKVFLDGRLQVISNKGWIKKGTPYIHQYGEQPMEVASIIEALYIFYQATGEHRYKDYLQMAFSWFIGNNHLNQMVYHPVNGGCHDGVEEFEINSNQGAESTLSYIVSRLTMDKVKQDDSFLYDLLAFKISPSASSLHHN
jgi:glycosyltransferase involved in cell wall biosynthesis